MRISDWSSDVCSSDLLALQFRRYPHAQVYIFDKGFSARAAVLAMGGAHHALGLGSDGPDSEGALAFQPDRKSVVSGKSVSVRVDLGGRRIIKKKKKKKTTINNVSQYSNKQ